MLSREALGVRSTKPATSEDLASALGSDADLGSHLSVGPSGGTFNSKRSSGQGSPASSPRHGKRAVKDKELDYHTNFEHFDKCLRACIEVIKHAKQDGK